MNMYIHELKVYRKSTIVWTLSLIAIVILFMSIFPAFAKDAATFQKYIDSIPKALTAALGITSLDLSVLGFYSVIFTYIMLCGAIQAMNIGLSIVSNEERGKTADFLLSKPITRQQIITSKLLAALTSIVITNIIFITVATIVLQSVKTEPFSINKFALISLSLFLTQLIFVSMGVFISIIVKKIKSVLPISLGIVFGFFIIGMLGSVIGDDVAKYITPFKYFDPAKIIKNSAYETQFVVITIVFVILATVGSYVLYSKKDMANV
ncbi:MAG TPA: ABC transporter permease subunit [Clostridia bacterium]|nr:ABC transporter permease subunit [Clostridia bacterium]